MGFGATMMNSCHISKKIVSEVEWDLYKEITCMIFMVFELKVVAIKFNMCYSFVWLQSYIVVLRYYIVVFVKGIYMIIFCLIEMKCFFNSCLFKA